MERLTEKHFGNEGYYMKCSEFCANDDEMCGGCPELDKIVNRLAAYEDTGLLPEEFKKAFNEDALLKMIAQYLGTTPDRLREWAKADKEDRLVALPCKVGDTVWYIDGGYYKPKEFCKVSRPHQIVEISYKLQRRSGKILEGFITDNGTRYSFNGIGKTVFMTREEAEAALAGERKDGEG